MSGFEGLRPQVFRKQREAIRLIKMGCGASEEELSSALLLARRRRCAADPS